MAAGKKKAKAKAKKASSKATPKKAKTKTSTSTRARASASGERFERGAYELPVMDLGEAIALATALLAVKGRPTAAIAEEAARVAWACERAKAVQGKGAGRETVDARAYDVAMDRAWATFVRRIQDHAELPLSRHPSAVEAGSVYAIVSDLSILKLNYLAEFAQIGARLDTLKREGLLDAARAIAGPAFLDEVLHCHGDYGEALGVFDAPESRGLTDRGEARLALVDAIGEYTFQVLAQARAGRPESWAAVHDALRPIKELRARQEKSLRSKPPPWTPQPHPPIGAA